MRIVVVAATGGVGGHVLRQARDGGHEVTAVVRNPCGVPADVPVTVTDLTDPDRAALRTAFTGADAVVSGFGPRGRKEIGIVARGTQAIVDAMWAAEARRLVVVSGAGVSTAPTPRRPDPPKREPGAGWLNQYVNTPLARLVLGRHFVDVASMEDVLRDSGLDWTAVRAPLLTNGRLTGRYRTAYERNVRRGFRLSRADTAHLMLDVLGRPETVGRAIAVAY